MQFANVMMQFLSHMERYMLTSGMSVTSQKCSYQELWLFKQSDDVAA